MESSTSQWLNPRTAWCWALAFTALIILLRLPFVSSLPLSGDEAYHWLWSKHLAGSYHEHPPLLGWAIAVATQLLGDSRLAVRLPSIIGMCLLCWALYRYASDRLRDPVTGVLAIVLCGASPILFFGAGYASTDLLFIGFYMAALWALGSDGHARDFILFGLFTGLAILTKLIGLILLPGILLALWFSTRREWLWRREFWYGLGVTAVLLLPLIFWNTSHGWPIITIRLGHHVGGQPFPGAYLLSLLIQETLTWGILIFYGMVAVLPGLLRRTLQNRQPAEALLCFPALLLLVVFLTKSTYSVVAFHWLTAAFVPLLLPLAQRWRKSPHVLVVAFLLAAALSTAVFGALYRPSILPDAHVEKLDIDTLKRELVDFSAVGTRLRQELTAASGPTFLIADEYGSASRWLFEAGTGDTPVILTKVPTRSGGSFKYWMAEQETRLRGADAVYIHRHDSGGDDDTDTSPDLLRAQAAAKVTDYFSQVNPLPDIVIYHDGIEIWRFFLIRCHNYRGGLS